MKLVFIVVLVISMPCAGQVPLEQSLTFEGYVLLDLSTEYGHALFRECNLTVHLPQGGAPARSRLNCTRSTNNAEQIEAAHQFTLDETIDLRRMLRAADLFGPGNIGTDTRAVDGYLAVLTVTDSGSTAALVVSGNPTFTNPGPRKELSDWLMAQHRDLVGDRSQETHDQ